MLLKTLSLFIALLLQMIGFVSACNDWCTCLNGDGSHFCTCRAKKGSGYCPCCADLNLGHRCCNAFFGCARRFKCSAAQVFTQGNCCPKALNDCKARVAYGCLNVNGHNTCVKETSYDCSSPRHTCSAGSSMYPAIDSDVCICTTVYPTVSDPTRAC
ncbi:unnamed protein product [Cercospora beticola]|nr:unnamed protein product [Cercospora beticola]